MMMTMIKKHSKGIIIIISIFYPHTNTVSHHAIVISRYYNAKLNGASFFVYWMSWKKIQKEEV